MMSATPTTPRPRPLLTPACPTCWHVAVRSHTSSEGGVSTAFHLCPNNHGWMVKWVTA